jgi:TrpR-related protein YerC/YecD
MARLLESLQTIQTSDEMEAFLHDILTPHEIKELAQRLEVASLLNQGMPYVRVSRTTGASSTTVSRVSKCLNGEVGGYRLVLGRLAQVHVQ